MSEALSRKEQESNELAIRLRMCEAQIEDSRRVATRHGLFALIGASPATLIPMLGLGADFGPQVAVVASALVAGLEGWRWLRARLDLRAAEAERVRLLGPLPAADTDR